MSDSIKDLTKLKVADLKRELKSRNLSTVGNKQELQDRLQMALQDDSTLLLDDTGTVDTEDILNEDDVLAVSDGDDSDIGNTAITPDEGSATLKRHIDDDLDDETVTSTPTEKTVVVQDNGPPAKKVTLNRKIAAPQTATTTSTTVAQPASGKEDVEMEDAKEKNTAEDTGKKVIKLSAISMKERLELRAAKFGSAPATDGAKKEARAARFGSSSVTSANSVPEVSADTLKKRAERFGIQPGSKVEQVELEERKKKRLERFGDSGTATNGSGNSAKTTPTPVSSKPGRVPITAPTGSSTNSSLEEKKRMREERFKTSTAISTK